MVARATRPTGARPVAFGGALSFTIVALLLLLMPAVPPGGRLLGAALLALGWVLAGACWAVRRYGRIAALSITGLVFVASGAVGYAYWQDGPNRRTAAQVKDLGALYVGTTGTFLTGEVDYVYFDEEAGDEEVNRFTQLEGLGGLRRLVLKGTRITDATGEQLGRFSGLRQLYLEETGVSPTTVDKLRRDLSRCTIEVR